MTIPNRGAVTLEEYAAAFSLSFEQQERIQRLREKFASNDARLAEVNALARRTEKALQDLAALFEESHIPARN